MKLLVLLSRIPYPLEKGDKLRAYHQIRCLSANHEIHLLAVHHEPIHPDAARELKKYCQSVRFFKINLIQAGINILLKFLSRKPLQVGYFHNLSTHRKIQKAIQEIQPEHIYCQLIRVAEYVKHTPIRKTLDYQDVFSKGVERRIEKAPWYFKPVLKLEYKRLLKYEKDIFDDFDHKTIISEPDRELIPHPLNHEIQVIGNGVDFNFFKPVTVEKKYDIIFSGNMGYPPNVDAAVYLVKEVIPALRQLRGKVKVVIAGATPHPKVKALQSEEVTVTGWVDDIRDYYAASRVFIAPMKIGTGLQNKLLEAMAMKLPCVTSPLANNALNARNGIEILVGENTEQYVLYLHQLLANNELAKNIADNGNRFVHEHYNWEAITAELDRLFEP